MFESLNETHKYFKFLVVQYTTVCARQFFIHTKKPLTEEETTRDG